MDREQRRKLKEAGKILWVVAGIFFLTALVLAQGFGVAFSGVWAAIVIFIMFLCAETAMLLQTILNKNKKSGKVAFVAKLAFIFGLFAYSVLDLIVRLL